MEQEMSTSRGPHRAEAQTRPIHPPAAEAAEPEMGPERHAADFDHLVDEDLPPDFFETPGESEQKIMGMPRRTAYLVIAGAVVVVLAVIAFFVLATAFSWWPVVLDIVLVIAALTTAFLLGCLIYAILTLVRVALSIRDELVPVIRSLGSTTEAVADTARAATGYAVRPAARTVGLVTGTLGTLSAMMGNQARKRSHSRQLRRDQIAREMAEQAEAKLDREIGQQVREDIGRRSHETGATL